MEKAGVLFLIPAPKPNANLPALFDQACPEELAKELEVYHLDKHHLCASQSFRVPSNWKLMNDAGGEPYHVPALHKMVATTCAQGSEKKHIASTHRAFGPQAQLYCFGKFTAELLADGRVEESRFDRKTESSHASSCAS